MFHSWNVSPPVRWWRGKAGPAPPSVKGRGTGDTLWSQIFSASAKEGIDPLIFVPLKWMFNGKKNSRLFFFQENFISKICIKTKKHLNNQPNWAELRYSHSGYGFDRIQTFSLKLCLSHQTPQIWNNYVFFINKNEEGCGRRDERRKCRRDNNRSMGVWAQTGRKKSQELNWGKDL